MWYIFDGAVCFCVGVLMATQILVPVKRMEQTLLDKIRALEIAIRVK